MPKPDEGATAAQILAEAIKTFDEGGIPTMDGWLALREFIAESSRLRERVERLVAGLQDISEVNPDRRQHGDVLIGRNLRWCIERAKQALLAPDSGTASQTEEPTK